MSRAFTRERDDAPEPILAPQRRSTPSPVRPEDPNVVGYGAKVAISGCDGTTQYFIIVDEDAIDIPNGRIGVESPLARTLLGARVGDIVVWQRPAGDRSVRVESIDYDHASPTNGPSR
jgi:transcription elongation GreA/GreB family factor